MTSVTGGSVTWKLDVDDTKLNAGLTSAKAKVASTAKTTSTFFTKAKAGSAFFAKGFLVAGAAVSAAGGYLLKSSASVEMMRQNIDTLVGSADKGKQVFGDLYKMAAKTPFEMTDLMDASQTMLSFGVNVKDLLPNLKMLGDVSMGNRDKFGRLSLAFGQVQASGRLMGQYLMQMIDAGFHPLKTISEKTGKSMKQLKDDMEKGKISADMVTGAFKDATSNGGRFFKGMERGAKTLPGLWSTLKDTFMMTGREIIGLNKYGDIVEGGFVDKIKTAVTGLIEFFNKNSGQITKFFSDFFGFIQKNAPIVAGILKGLMLALAPVINKVKQVMTIFIPLIVQIKDAIMTGLVPAFKELWEKHGAEIIKMLKILGVIIGVYIVANLAILLGAIYGIIKVITWLVKAFTAVSSAGKWVTNTLVFLFSKLPAKIWGWIKGIPEVFGKVWEQVNTGVGNAIHSIVQWFKDLPGKVADAVKGLGSSIGDNIKGALGGIGIPGFASGVQNFGGGLAVVGEQGPELVRLPKGTDVYSNAQSKNMVSGSAVHIHMDGVFVRSKTELADMIIEGIDAANMRLKGAGKPQIVKA